MGLPLALLMLVWLLVPRDYVTGTNSVNTFTYVLSSDRGQIVCVPGLKLPAGTAGLRMHVVSHTRVRPRLDLVLRSAAGELRSSLGPTRIRGTRVSAPVFRFARSAPRPAARAATLCVTAGDKVNWGGVPLAVHGDVPQDPGSTPTLNGTPALGARVAVAFLPAAGEQRSYLQRAGDTLRRAALFRPGWCGVWLYVFVLLVVLPGLALAAIRLIALTAAGRGRRVGLWLFSICALNAVCWSLITPAFQVPDEVDHFAYVASIATRGKSPDKANTGRARWSSAETAAILATRFDLDHQAADTKVPWLASDVSFYEAYRRTHVARDGDGGGPETAAPHGPLYYLAVAPGFLAGGAGNVFDQLQLSRFISALIGALPALFTYLMCAEVAPGRRWLGVLAGLLVAFEPMYGFISGGVNNDVGVNAAAAALELLLLRLVIRGPTVPRVLASAVVLMLAPQFKGTAYSLFPLAGLAFALALVRHHTRRDAGRWGLLLGAAAATQALWTRIAPTFGSHVFTTVGGGSPVTSTGALQHPLGYVSYLWQVFLPRLSFMHEHFAVGVPAFQIFVERGFGAFGWYDVLFPDWVLRLIEAAMLLTALLGLLAARRERAYVRRMLPALLLLVATPAAVVAGFEAAFYYDNGLRPAVAEFGRYAFPAIGPLAILVIGSLHAFGRRRLLAAGTGLVVAMIALSIAGQLLELTAFYA
ncbi:MAG: hypothetical protein NVSMB51_07770 [Solirubrobacteraceae bacterium]